MLKKFMIRRVVLLTLITCCMISGNLIFSYGADESTIKQLKEKLIIADKILELGKLATPYGHVSVRIPGTESFSSQGVLPRAWPPWTTSWYVI